MSIQNNSAFRANAVFIGGGPVGLFAAAQMKALNPSANITVIERYTEYKRKHVLIINPASLAGIANHPDLKKFASSIKKTNTIATSKIESDLKKIALKVGVNILNERIDDPLEIKERFKNAKVIFGTDGAHSTVREKIFEGKESVRETVSHIAEVKYFAKGSGTKTPRLIRSTLKHMNHNWITEHVGKKGTNNQTPITFRLALSNREFELLRSSGKATFKDPLKIDSEEDQKSIPDRLKKTIETWLKVKKELYKEDALDVKITATNLDVYRSEEFVTEKEGVKYALIGDAAFGVPYFRSLNNGLLCATHAAKAFAPVLTTEAEDIGGACDSYNTYATTLASSEISNAKLKGAALDAYSKSIGFVSDITPLPFKEKLLDLCTRLVLLVQRIIRAIRSTFYSLNPLRGATA